MIFTILCNVFAMIFPFISTSPSTVPVRIVIGQSNASGALFTADLPTDLQSPILNGNAVARIWTGSQFETMQPAVNTALLDSTNDRFGIESFAAKRHVDAGQSPYFIKVSRAAASILERSGPDFEVDLADELNDWIRDGIAALPSGNNYEIQVLWFQGEAESNTNAANSGPTGDAAVYSQSFDTVIYNVVNAHTPNAKWYDVKMHDGLPAGNYPNLTTVQAQKDIVATNHSNITQVDGNQLSYQADQVHVDVAGFQTLLTLIGNF